MSGSTPNAAATSSASSPTVVGSSAPTLNTSPRLAGTSTQRGNQRRNVVDVRERALLRAVAEDRHRLSLHHLVHEDADDVPVTVADVLVLAVDVVRTEDRVLEPEHLVRGAQVELDRVLRDAVRVLGLGVKSSVIGS